VKKKKNPQPQWLPLSMEYHTWISYWWPSNSSFPVSSNRSTAAYRRGVVVASLIGKVLRLLLFVICLLSFFFIIYMAVFDFLMLKDW